MAAKSERGDWKQGRSGVLHFAWHKDSVLSGQDLRAAHMGE